jgi:hypothetical protein
VGLEVFLVVLPAPDRGAVERLSHFREGWRADDLAAGRVQAVGALQYLNGRGIVTLIWIPPRKAKALTKERPAGIKTKYEPIRQQTSAEEGSSAVVAFSPSPSEIVMHNLRVLDLKPYE